MGLLGGLFRLYAYVFHLLLSLFLLAISAGPFSQGTHNLRLPMLPWEGKDLTYWVFGAAVTGLVSIVLAATGLFRLLFALFATAVFGFLARGYLLSNFVFSGSDHFVSALWFLVGALVAAVTAWRNLTAKPQPRYR